MAILKFCFKSSDVISLQNVKCIEILAVFLEKACLPQGFTVDSEALSDDGVYPQDATRGKEAKCLQNTHKEKLPG